MRITVEIDESVLAEIQKLTGLAKKSPAVSQALQDYLHQERKRRFIARVMEGETDYSATNEELESGPAYDSD